MAWVDCWKTEQCGWGVRRMGWRAWDIRRMAWHAWDDVRKMRWHEWSVRRTEQRSGMLGGWHGMGGMFRGRDAVGNAGCGTGWEAHHHNLAMLHSGVNRHPNYCCEVSWLAYPCMDWSAPRFLENPYRYPCPASSTPHRLPHQSSVIAPPSVPA